MLNALLWRYIILKINTKKVKKIAYVPTLQQKHAGFTLIELMIALALGLIIVAAGLAIFLSSSRSLNLQSGLGELQQNANFGLSLVTYDLRHTNLNTVSSHRINPFVNGSGLIFAKKNLPTSLHAWGDLETKYVTVEDHNLDNTTGKSDQITMQYVPAVDSIVNCEGEEVEDASTKTIVQRYYLAAPSQQVTGEPTSYSLFCDAGLYESGGTTIEGLGTNAQQIMQRVDAFKIRLGVKNPAGHLRYMTIDEYSDEMTSIRNACTTPIVEDVCAASYLNVISIQVGILSRSTGTIGADASLNTKATFEVAGHTVTLDGDSVQNRRYLRQVVNQVVAIRNTLGAS